MFQAISHYIAPSGMRSPLLWGDEAVLRDRLRQGTTHIRCALRTYRLAYPFPPDQVVDFFRAHYGPMTLAFASLDANAQANLRSDLVRLWSTHNRSANATDVAAEYLEVIATRE
jgi:hypothetical protein